MIQEKILKIATALSIEKDGKVDTGKKRFQYRKLEDIRMALKPLLVKNKVFYKPNAIRQNDVLIFQVCFLISKTALCIFFSRSSSSPRFSTSAGSSNNESCSAQGDA